MIEASGILFLTPSNKALLLKRGDGGDHPNEWCFPGGKKEDDETIEECAEREAKEELGFVPEGERVLLTRRIAEGVDYTTFIQRVSDEFEPRLNGEHTAFQWVDVDDVFGNQTAADSDFKEEEHPRDEDGKFTEGSGNGKKQDTKIHLKEAKTREIEGANGKKTIERLSATGEPLPSHIQKLKIPPAWTDVKYSDDPDAPLQAIGKDAKGREQRVYSLRFAQANASAKFARIHELMDKFEDIVKQNNEARSAKNAKLKDSADCLLLIMKMGVRPGSDSDTGAKEKAYGATTLEGKHVVETEGGVSLQFIGKKSVRLNLPVRDKELATMLLERSRNAGADGKLFPATSDKALLDHVHSLDGGGFKSKDFRTHVGTTTAYRLVNEMEAPKNETEYKKRVMDVAKAVSKELGNTPIMALQAYISPTVFSQWRMDAGI